MSLLTGAAITMGAGSMLSGLYSAHKGAKTTKNENAAQRAWEKEKMQNAYQWSVEDMQKAGLNPVAMYGDGGNATMTGGTVAGDPGDSYNTMGQNTASAMSLALQAEKQNAEIENIKANTGLLNAQSGKTDAEIEKVIADVSKSKAETMKIIAEAGLTKQEQRNAEAQLQLLYGQMEKVSEEIRIARSQGDIMKVNAAFAKAKAIQDQITGYVDSVSGLIGAIKGTSALPTKSKNQSWVGGMSYLQ